MKDWKVYTIPVDYSFARDKQYKQQENAGNQPAYYRSTFNLNELGDTFLNMMNWSKGMVWVNGHAIVVIGKSDLNRPYMCRAAG